jgi:hypothetical protein
MASPSHPPPVGIFIVKRRGGKKEKDRPDETEGNLEVCPSTDIRFGGIDCPSSFSQSCQIDFKRKQYLANYQKASFIFFLLLYLETCLLVTTVLIYWLKQQKN